MYLAFNNRKNFEMVRENHNRISIERMARQLHVNVITETENFIISKNSNSLQNHPFDFDHPHILDGIAIVFCIKGEAKVKINLTEYDITKNTVFVAAPNSIVQILEQSSDLEVDFLFFTFEFISDIPLSNRLGEIAKAVEEQACLYLSYDVFEDFLTIHRLILKQYQRSNNYRDKTIKNYLYALVYQILREYTTQERGINPSSVRSRKDEIYRQFMALLYEHYRAERSVRFYADRLYLTPKYFSTVIKVSSGRSVSEWIDEMVIMAAKALLKGSDLTVTQIAIELEFASASFFGSYFKKRTGITPLQYRKQDLIGQSPSNTGYNPAKNRSIEHFKGNFKHS